jgi:hypothetical protein
MKHLLTTYLGPKTTAPGEPPLQVMLTACNRKAVTKVGIEPGHLLVTPEGGDATCPGCAEAMTVLRLQEARERDAAERRQRDAHGMEDADPLPNDDPSLGAYGSTDGMGPAQEENG